MAGFNIKRRTPYDAVAGITTPDGSPLTTFGESQVSQLNPIAQGDFIYGLNSLLFSSGTFAGGTVSNSSNLGVVESGTGSNGLAVLRLRRGLKYRPGMGSLMRATCLFDTPVSGNSQLLGLGNTESGYYFGYSGTSFGIFHQETATPEIRKLTIGTPVTTSELVTITLNGNAITIPVTGTADANKTSYQISLADFSNVGTGWRADAIDGTIFFSSVRAEPLTGSYSVSGATISGSFTTIQTGVSPTTTFISQSSWNIDRLDGGVSGGPNPSRMVLDTSKGNVYQIGFQYLGFGNAIFAVEDSTNGRMNAVHEIKNANARTTTVLKNPQVACRLVSANNGATTNVKPKTASMAIFTEGMIKKLDPRFYRANTFSNYNSTTPAPVIALKVNRVFNSKQCYGELDIMRMDAANEATTKTLTVSLYKDVTIGGVVNFQYVSQTNSSVSVALLSSSTNTVDVTGKTPFFSFSVGPDSATTVDLTQEEITIGTGEIVVATISTSGQISGLVGINWFEQQ